MAGNVKGITIEFKGETTSLQKALKDVRNDSKDVDKELGYINNALKFNPKDVELTTQKMAVLEKASEDANKNLKDLKDALQQMKDSGVDETSAEYRELERQIKYTEQKQKTYNAELKKLDPSKLEQAAAKMKSLGDGLVTAGEKLAPLSAAAGAVDVALAGIAVSGGKTADELITLSNQTGVSTDDLQKYAAAADLVDVSVDTMANSQVKLKKSMYQATQGSKKQTAAFDKLGVSVTDSNGKLRDQGDVFDEVIAALGSMENETERDALAMQIFGGNAKELNSLIKDGGETYKKVAKIYSDNDLAIVDEETLKKANEFNDSLDTIKLTAQAALANVGTQLAGYLAPALEKVTGWVSKLMGWLSKLDPEVLTVIGIIAGVVAALAPLLIVVGKVATGISSIMSLATKLGPVLTALTGPVGIVIAIIAALIAVGVLLYKNWDTIKAKAKEVKDWVVRKWTELKTSITNIFNSIKTFVTNTWNNIKTSVVNTVKNLVNAVKVLWLAFKLGLQTIVEGIKTTITTKWEAIKTAVSTKVEAIKTAITTKWEAIKTAISTKIEAIKTAISTKWEAIKTTISTKVEAIKTALSTKWESIKSTVTGKIDALKTAVETKFNAIKEKITGPIEKAKEKVKSIVDKIKSIFSGTKLELPKFKLPHLKVDGGEAPWGIGGKGKLPSFSVDWYKKGGIFNSPTIIGVGEAGAEAVLPIEKLKDWMQPNGITINVYGSSNMDVNELAAAVERKLVNSVKRQQYAWG